jgi:hypothetical protein
MLSPGWGKGASGHLKNAKTVFSALLIADVRLTRPAGLGSPARQPPLAPSASSALRAALRF